jgi:capsular polysaccharide biosynthesis protein
MEKTNEDIEIDLVDLFYVIRARLWVIILSGVLFATVAGLVSSFLITPMYTSTSQMYILSKSTSITSLADIQLGSQLTQDYMIMVKSRTVVNQVIKDLNLDMDYDALSGIVTVTNPTQTRILNISCNYPNAEMAKRIVDEFAKVSKISIAQLTASDEPTIIDWGYASPYPSSPNIKKYIIIGALAGIFLAAGIVIVLHLMDDTIKDSEDVEKYLGLSTLGLIPLEAGGAKQAQIDKKKRNQKAVKKNRKGK